MVMGEVRALAVSILIISLGLLQMALGALEIASAPETLRVVAPAAVKLLCGLVLLQTAREINALRKRGLWLAIVGFPGIVVAHLVPLLLWSGTRLSVVSVLLSLSLLLYLFIHEDALGPESHRELSEEMNTHEFIR